MSRYITICLLVLLATAFAVTNSIEGREKSSASASGSGITEETGKQVITDENEVNFKSAHIQDFFEGDIRLTPKQIEMMKIGTSEEKGLHHINERAVVRNIADTWPGAVVPYVFSSSLASSHRSAINRAIQRYTDQTCVRFVPRRDERNYVVFFRGNGCYSYVGRIGNIQEVSIGDGCDSEGIVLHEIFHVLGRWHEQSRPDRDTYIRVHFNNIIRGFESQFSKVSEATTNQIAYDYYSIMHYSAYAFSKNRGPTITPRDPSISINSLGQRRTFSSKDLQHINKLYCSDTGEERSEWSSWSTWSQCSTSCGSGRQTRTRTCSGACTEKSNIQTRSCNLGSCPGQWGEWSSWSSCSPSCGTNRQRSRTRRCQSGQCLGNSRQTQGCSSNNCQNRGMSEWMTLIPCNSRCNNYEIRSRICLDPSLGCAPPYLTLRRCTAEICSISRVNHNPGDSEPTMMKFTSGALPATPPFLMCVVLTYLLAWSTL